VTHRQIFLLPKIQALLTNTWNITTGLKLCRSIRIAKAIPTKPKSLTVATTVMSEDQIVSVTQRSGFQNFL
jgi:hypothetical protein